MKRIRRDSPPRRSGYTLLEMMSTMTSVSVLLIGMASTLYITLRATDPDSTPTAAILEGNAAVTDLLSEIEYAQSFSERTATAITFTVPDRNGDSVSETIRYAWSGVAGAPLTRQYNGGTATTLVENVHAFQHDLPVASPNLLFNAGMESGTSSWTAMTNASISNTNAIAHSGSRSMAVSALLLLNNAGIRQDVTSLIANGTTYDVGGWLRRSGILPPYDVRIRLRITSTGSGEQIFATNAYAINASSWTHVKGTLSPTWSGTLVSAYFEVCGTSNISDFYLDDVDLKVHQSNSQSVNVDLQVGGDSDALIHSGIHLLNLPL